MPEVERPKFRKDAKQTERSLKGKGVGDFRGIVRFWKGWCGARGLLSFCDGCGDEEVRCNGRSKQGKDALSVCAQGLCKDAKPTKHTQTITLRKILNDSANVKPCEDIQTFVLKNN